MLRSFRAAAAALLLTALASPAFAGSVALLTGPLEPNQMQPTLNTLINTMNAAYANNGSGNLNTAITIPTVASAVNGLTITPGATGTAPLISGGGLNPDANLSIGIAGSGSGTIFLGGTTAATSSMQVANTSSSVDYWAVNGSAAGSPGVISMVATGTDSAISVLIASKGTGGVHMGGTTRANGSLRVGNVASAVNEVDVEGAVTTAEPVISVAGSSADAAIGIILAGKSTGQAALGGSTVANSSLSAPTTASAVNHFVATGTATGSAPTLLAGGSGSDAGVGAKFGTAGTGNIQFLTDGTVVGMQITRTASAVDYLITTPAASGANPKLGVLTSNLVFGSGSALVTTSTTGMILIPGTAGTPSGVVVGAGLGAIPMIYDTTAHKLWLDDNGTWKFISAT